VNHFTFDAHSEADTDRLGAALADVLPDGTTVALIGTLGAGKTRLVRAIAAAVGIPPDQVVSPTFVLCQQYRGRRELAHLDAFRLKSPDDLLELGFDELVDSPAIVLVEWADRVAASLPNDRLEIRIEVTGPTSRRFEILAHAPSLHPLVARLAALLKDKDREIGPAA
jgi:tRNA threonylcarbamoyladenosine biosynthesis protein TsaE